MTFDLRGREEDKKITATEIEANERRKVSGEKRGK